MVNLIIKELPKKIYFCRHGESIGNALGLDDNSLRDLPNHRFPLTEKGSGQIKLLAGYIRNHKLFSDVENVYASNFLRAQQTLDIIMSANEISIVPNEDSRIDEWWKGIFHSLSTAEIDEHYAIEPMIMKREGWHHYRPPQGEAGKDVEARLIDFLNGLRGNSFISSHGRVAGFMKRVLCNEPVDMDCKYINPHNGELWLFTKEQKNYRYQSLFNPGELQNH